MINMPAAMDRLLGSPLPTKRPLVAVIDSGITSNHPDLQAQIAHQASFTGNGLFSTSGDDPTSINNVENSPGFHGTHVAGTIAASTFNGVGVAGVAPMAQLMPIRIFDSASASKYNMQQAILYAAGLPNASGTVPPRRADVINMSLGGTYYSPCDAAEGDAIARARAVGVIVVVSSGNASDNRVHSPGNCPGVISVGALNTQRQKTSYSNSGQGLTVAAPGGDQSGSIFSTLADFNAQGSRVPSYGAMNGTSMAAPHVAGVMALMRFVNPNITPDQISKAFAAGQLTDDIGTPGYDLNTGWDLINARKAIDTALALQGGAQPPAKPGQVVAQPASLELGSLRTSIDLELTTNAAASETLTSLVSPSPAVTVAAKQINPTTKLGTYTITVNRNALSQESNFINLLATTSTGRQFNINVSVQKSTGAGTGTDANLGAIYVIIADAETGTRIGLSTATLSDGRYTWQYSGKLPASITLLAGSDIDHDNKTCLRGEACGSYPVLDSELTPIAVNGGRSDLNFVVAPLGGISDVNTNALHQAGDSH